MAEITNQALVKRAGAAAKRKMVGDRLFADVGCALVTEKGNIYLGVCIDTSGKVLCAEQSAIAAMITAGEYRIKKIVAVWKNEEGATRIIPPCGHCREFIRQIDSDNLDTEVILKDGKAKKLSELLPYHDWFS